MGKQQKRCLEDATIRGMNAAAETNKNTPEKLARMAEKASIISSKLEESIHRASKFDVDELALDLFRLLQETAKDSANSVAATFCEFTETKCNQNGNESMGGSWSTDDTSNGLTAYFSPDLDMCYLTHKKVKLDMGKLKLTSSKSTRPFVYEGNATWWEGTEGDFKVTLTLTKYPESDTMDCDLKVMQLQVMPRLSNSPSDGYNTYDPCYGCGGRYKFTLQHVTEL